MIEIAARSIGGFCSRALRFREDVSLEELILRDALGMETDSFHREPHASGVMMIPIPRAGFLNEVRGLLEAKAVKNIVDVVISTHLGKEVVPLPEGGKYLGFIFSRAQAPKEVEVALREAHRRMEFSIIAK